MSLNLEKLGVTPTTHLNIRLPTAIVEAVDAVASRIDPFMSAGNRSLWIRHAIVEKLKRDKALSEMTR